VAIHPFGGGTSFGFGASMAPAINTVAIHLSITGVRYHEEVDLVVGQLLASNGFS
jgi:hypothetical protein